jgi:hypothetical protein
LAAVAEDDEPMDSTRIDELRLDDLANEQTRVQARPDGSAAEDEKTDEAKAGSRSPKDKTT